jgi:hypothetical protein
MSSFKPLLAYTIKNVEVLKYPVVITVEAA